MTVTDAPKIITGRFDFDDSHTLARYEATGGYQALRKALTMQPQHIVDEVKTASLLGRGGAGFPAGVKWGFCPPGVWPRYLVVNGDESEPGTYKDRLLLERDPHQLIEGMLITCFAVGCAQAFLYVRGEMALAQERLAQALNDAYAAGYVGKNILGSRFSVDIVLHWGAGAYIVGEETTLIESLEGNRGMPRLKPPFFPAAKGLYMQPTIVNNVETLSNIPWIVQNGAAAFDALGAESSKGTRMFAVSGHVKRPGVFEVEYGVTTFRDIIYAPVYAGGVRGDRALKAYIPGGASSPWFYEEHLDLPLEKATVDKAGSMLGSGAIVIMDETTDMVRACHRVVKFFAVESCGKCTPCREGTAWLERILKRIIDGYGRPSDLQLLMDVSDNISPGIAWPPKQTTICPLGPSAVSPIASALQRFRPEFEAYIAKGPFAAPGIDPRGGRERADRVGWRWRVVTDTSTADSPGKAEVDGVNVTVNGVDIVANKGELVIAAAERNDVYIPRFCYHPRMESVGMCRMCIVEIDTGRGPALQPACMLECTEGMKVDTESAVTQKAQDGVLEFLLINHPLDCPVCDKGGECPLQDQTMAYGPGESRFVEEKRHYEKPIPISELVYLDRERCILCDRCTRFAKDVAGDPLIHFLDRGSQTEVNTFPDHPFASYFSGNTVQICPVGALTASTYRFRARPWDLEATESTCQGCSVGCRISIESSRDEVLRYLGVDIDPVNWGWLCDKGRFDFQAVNSPARLTDPILRQAGSDEAVSVRWAGAMKTVAQAIRRGLDAGGPNAVAVLGGARLTNESAYAWSKLAKGVIGTDNVDAQIGDGLPAELVLGLPRATIDDACRAGGTVMILGTDVKEELPVLHLRLRHAVESDGVRIVEVSPRLTSTSSIATTSLAVRPGEQAAVLRAVFEGDVSREVGGVAPEFLAAARTVLDGDGPITVVVGRGSLAESEQGIVDAVVVLTSSPRPIRFLSALRRANVHGALDMGLAPGVLPGRVALDEGRAWFAGEWPNVPATRGMDATQMLQAAADGRIEVLLLLGADPISDFPDRDLASRALAGARTVIAIDQFLTASSHRADIVLPAAGFTEVPGTATNIEGRVSTLNQRVTPPGTAQADWIIAADLAAQLGTDLHLESIEQIRAEIARLSPAYRGVDDELLSSEAGSDGVVVPLPNPPVSASPTAAEVQEPGGKSDGEPDDEGEVEAEEAPVGDPMPSMLTWNAPRPADAPALDNYSLRLIATRKLYDDGVLVQRSPSLAALAEGTRVAVNPYDFDRIGVRDGAKVQVTSPKTTMTLDIEIDPGVPRGCAAVRFNQPDVPVADLIDATARFTDVRLERKDG